LQSIADKHATQRHITGRILVTVLQRLDAAGIAAFDELVTPSDVLTGNLPGAISGRGHRKQQCRTEDVGNLQRNMVVAVAESWQVEQTA
jgi:hypothetical protein